MLLCFPLYAQELDEQLPRKTEASISNTSESSEPALEIPDIGDSIVASIGEPPEEKEILEANTEDSDLESKEAQLGMILRDAYYQKLTTPRWAKILSAESWRAAFLKWRYYAQMEDYVRSSSYEVVKMKRLPAQAIMNRNLPEEVDVKEELGMEVDTIVSIDSNLEEISDQVSQEELLTKNPRETTVEESFDSDSVELDPTRFSFTLADLSLPDSMHSERELYFREDVATLKPAMALDNEIVEVNNKPDPQETTEARAQEDNSIVEAENLEEAPKPEPEKKDLQSEVIQNVTETNTNTSVAETSNQTVQVPSVERVDRRTITEKFASMYKKLPWPVNGGVVTDKYGYRKNAAARGLKSENYGIDISAPSSSKIKAVFEGTVIMAMSQVPYDYIVTLKHGDFTTAYYFLSDVHVKVGDRIAAGQSLGSLRQSTGMAPFHFEIWQDQERINPEPWLRP